MVMPRLARRFGADPRLYWRCRAAST